MIKFRGVYRFDVECGRGTEGKWMEIEMEMERSGVNVRQRISVLLSTPPA